MARILRLGLLVSISLVVVLPTAARAQNGQPHADQRWRALTDGAYAYTLYCAQCHGDTGRGNGLKAKMLPTPVPDLRLIATRHRGFDPTFVVEHIYATNAWERRPMPAWGYVIRNGSGRSDAYALLAAHNLMRHVQSLQELQASR
jgi:mono/diheme cytochrome c family protein